jgi:hypothetical protein
VEYPGIGRPTCETLFHEIAQVFLFQRNAIRDGIRVPQSDRRREHATTIPKRRCSRRNSDMVEVVCKET